MTRNFFNNFVRGLFSSIDYYIYSSIEWVTQGIFDIAELRTNVTIVETVRNKIYIILGIIMLFKITASLINYMINPDQMSDKEKGASKLISRTVLMLALLILLPTIFTFIYRAQSAFLPLLPKFILGEQANEINENVSENSNKMAVTLLQTFFHPYYVKEEGEEEFTAVDDVPEITSLAEFNENVNAGSGISIPLLGIDASYQYEYRFLLSTIVGIIVLALLVSITIDLAVRLFKMVILEMLAPIPIISYIDPKSQKDGPFQSWLKETIHTFLEIFIKLGLIYLALFFIAELQNNSLFVSYGSAEGTGISPVRLMYLRVFLIIGLLVFLKQASKFIKSMLGIKDNKNGGSFIGNVVSGIAGFGAGAVSGAISGRGLRGAITGGITGMAAGYQSAVTGKPTSTWQAGGDAAIQARLGDKNAKSGIIARLQTKASQAQMKSAAANLNLTEKTISLAKQNWLTAQADATDAEWKYREIITRGPEEGETQEAYNQRRNAAYNDWQDKATQSGNAERNYKKGKEAYDRAYNQEGKPYNLYQNGAVHRATKRAKAGAKEVGTSFVDGVSTAAGGSTIARRREERTNRNTSNGGFNPNKRD